MKTITAIVIYLIEAAGIALLILGGTAAVCIFIAELIHLLS